MPRWTLIFAAICLAATARAQNASGNVPTAPRLGQFSDTLGANFDIADSSSHHGTASDFDFLVGVWEFDFQNRRTDGQFSPAFHGHWFASKKFSSNAFIEDHFRADVPNVPYDVGTWTYRVFNPQRTLWTMEGVGSQQGDWAPGLCWSDGDRRYAIQWYPGFLMRIRYSDIKDDSFLWRADISRDSGKTWMRDWWTLKAKRISK